MPPKRLVLLFSPALCLLSGCHSQQLRGLTPDEQMAVDQAQADSALESDRAGVIFAQKTLELEERRQGAVDVSQPNTRSGSLDEARTDVSIAAMRLHLSEDREKVMIDFVNWRNFAKKLKSQEQATNSH